MHAETSVQQMQTHTKKKEDIPQQCSIQQAGRAIATVSSHLTFGSLPFSRLSCVLRHRHGRAERCVFAAPRVRGRTEWKSN